MSHAVPSIRPHDVLLIGGGPAALGALCAMIRTGVAERQSVLMLDDAPDRCGRIGDHAIPSDTQAEKFLTCLDGLPDRITQDTALVSLGDALAARSGRSAPLPLVGEFLARLKRLVLNDLRRRQSLVLRAARCDTLRYENGLWSVDNQPGALAHRLILACGASERRSDALATLIGLGLNPDATDKVVLSSEGFGWRRTEVEARLMDAETPRVAIVGGSHSAIASAAALLAGEAGTRLGTDAITLHHRRPMTATFDSPAAAREAGYADFGADDICPVTGRVHALGGFRLDSRALLMRLRGWGGAPAEPRVRTVDLTNADALRRSLADATVVISALGYRPDFPRMIVSGQAVRFGGQTHVDPQSRLLDADGQVLPAAQAVGLAMGYDLRGRFGEPGFKGQANGLVLWFKEIAETVAGADGLSAMDDDLAAAAA
ncbi:MAG: hypothetical protein AAF311_04520 [Pseudomonadota bacterium]